MNFPERPETPQASQSRPRTTYSPWTAPKTARILSLIKAALRLPGVYQGASLLSATVFIVKSDSMKPYLTDRDLLLVNRLAYRLSLPSRGDVVIVRDPVQPTTHYVKRIIGLPGEHILMERGRVIIDSRPLVEPYAQSIEVTPTPFPNQWILDDDQYIVLGDQRNNSRDSRTFGPVGRHHIIGKVWVLFLPPGRWSKPG